LIEGKFNDTFTQHLREKQDQTLEAQVITRNGKIKDVAITANLLKTGGRKVLQGIFHDVTERKHAAALLKRQAQELEEANEKLRELDRMKSNFLSNVSHELRTPLTAIKGFAETIIRDKNMPEESRREFMEVIREDSEKLAVLIDRLLNLSRLEIGRVKLKKENIDLLTLTREVVESFGTQARLKELDFKADLPQELGPLYADPENIKEVLMQLLDNAIKYTEKGGKVGILLRDKGSEVVIAVSDTGAGIPDNEISHIFDMFYKVEKPTEQVGGIGMSLALVKYIVEGHGGRVQAESEVGKGSKFSFSLPKGREA
jgi:two-component system phosphate regulon sensor histidine kinase PhoR